MPSSYPDIWHMCNSGGMAFCTIRSKGAIYMRTTLKYVNEHNYNLGDPLYALIWDM